MVEQSVDYIRKCYDAVALEYAERFCNGTISVWKMQVAERAHNMIE